MDAKFQARKAALLEECQVDSRILTEVTPRLEQFMQPFVKHFVRREQVEHARTFVRGLLSDLESKNTESIAYRFDQDRLPLQVFIGRSSWSDQPLRDELARQVGHELGESDGVLVFDPSGFPKSGSQSVGVQRQWCGRLGKIDNCQVAVYLGYVSGRGHALVDTRIYLPKEWTTDRARMKKAGVPRGTRYRTRHELCLKMLDRHGAQLPHAWIAGDDEMGRPYWFRRDLHERSERYLLAVPSNTLIRDLEIEPPAWKQFGPHPGRPWVRVDRWIATLRDEDWTKLDVRDGTKGPLLIEVVKRRVAGRTDQRQQGHDEVLVVIRYKDRDDQTVVKTDYYLSDADPQTPLAEFARAAKAEHRIEECLQRGKSETGLGDYEVRNWVGWHHHQTLSLLAAWFLTTETRRGKKIDARFDFSPTPPSHRLHPPSRIPMRYTLSHSVRMPETTRT